MPNKVIENTANAYFDYGVLGITVVVLLIATGVLLFNILKDKRSDKQLADAITKMASNQENFVVMYQDSQKQHKEVIGILNETLAIERSNTKDCYINVGLKLDKILINQEKLEILTKI